MSALCPTRWTVSVFMYPFAYFPTFILHAKGRRRKGNLLLIRPVWWQQRRSEREALRTVKPKGPRWAAWSHCLTCLAIFLLLNFRDQGLVFTRELVILHTIHGGGGGVMGVRNSRTGRVLLAKKDGGLTQVLAKIQEGGIPAS